jgi:hypothetical protein
MPGALLGTDHIIAFLLHHFYLLYGSLILFSAAELITGLFWDGAALSHLPASAITNEFAYNRFASGPFGLRAQVGAMATITLPMTSGANTGNFQSAATLQLRTVNGNTFDVVVRME